LADFFTSIPHAANNSAGAELPSQVVGNVAADERRERAPELAAARLPARSNHLPERGQADTGHADSYFRFHFKLPPIALASIDEDRVARQQQARDNLIGDGRAEHDHATRSRRDVAVG